MLGNVAKVPVDGFERVEDISQFDEHFTKSHNEEKNEGCFIKVDVQYSEKLNDLYDDLSFERLKKSKKFVSSLHDKTEYIIQMRNLKQALNHELMLKKVHRVIRFNQKVWLKPYIDINTDLRKASKRDFQKYLLSWWIIRY